MKNIIISVVVFCLLVGGGVWLGVYLNNVNKTPTAVVELNLDGGTEASNTNNGATVKNELNGDDENPNVKLTVNAKNKVISVNYLNKKSEEVYGDIEVKGKSVDEVAKEYTVRLCKSGDSYGVDISAENGSKNIFSLSVTCPNAQQAEKIKENVVNKIDAAFDENGVYGAVKSYVATTRADLINKYNEFVSSASLKAKELEEMSEQEILDLINEKSKELEGISHDLYNKIDDFYNTTVAGLEKAIDNSYDLIDSAEKVLKNSESLTQAQKDELSKKISSAKEKISEERAEIQKQFNALLETLKEESASIIKEAKAAINSAIDEAKTIYEAHMEEFQKDKQATIDAIKEWRKTIENN